MVGRDFGMFRDRTSAGYQLATQLAEWRLSDPVVLALPRGGVPVGLEIARALNAPLDLLLVRKIGVPSRPELAAAAIVDGERPDIVFNDDVMAAAGLDVATIEELAARELTEIERRRSTYLSGRAPVAVSGRSAIVVDDGIATGATMRAAPTALKRRGPKFLLLAVPVTPPEILADLRPLVDAILCLASPDTFLAVGSCYRDFHQLSDPEVVRLLAQAPGWGLQ